MTKTHNKTIIYAQDFETTLGVFEINGHKSQHRADFYNVSTETLTQIEEINTLLKQINTVNEQDLIPFIKTVKNTIAELEKIIQNKKIHQFKINSKHGHGLEAGFEATIKEEYKK